MSSRQPLHALLFLLAGACGVILVLLSSVDTGMRVPHATVPHAVFATTTEPAHRDAGIEACAVEDIGIDEVLATSADVDMPPSRTPTLTDRSESRLSDICLGLVTPPPDA